MKNKNVGAIFSCCEGWSAKVGKTVLCFEKNLVFRFHMFRLLLYRLSAIVDELLKKVRVRVCYKEGIFFMISF